MASLLTWALTDPSLTHATGGPARNLMGPLGAIISDLMLQTLGFATAVALLPPTFWGLEMVLGERVLRFRTKLAFFPLSVLVLAGALSALPVPLGWPLHHGLGGILGDVVFNIASNIFAVINPDRAGAASGLLFFVSGFSALMYSLGLQMQDLVYLVRRSPYDSAGAWSDNLWAEAQRLRSGLGVRGPAPTTQTSNARCRTCASSQRAPIEREYDIADDDERDHQAYREPAPAAPHCKAVVLVAHPRRRRGRCPLPFAAAPSRASRREQGFDARTEAASRSIAERFAPSANEPAAATKIPGSSFLRKLRAKAQGRSRAAPTSAPRSIF